MTTENKNEFPDNFKFPKVTMKQRVLDKHGYYEKCHIDEDGTKTVILRRSFNPSMYGDHLTHDEAVNVYICCHADEDIIGNPGESVKDLMLRLGWIKMENGKVVEV